MNRISKRARAVVILIALLVGGLFAFLLEYAVSADEWVLAPGSPHIYSSGNIGTGTVVDRNGELLLDMGNKRTYSDDPAVRKATMHWLGDRQGRISAPAVPHYAMEMTGYNKVTGLYQYAGASGQAELTLSAEVQKTALEALGNRKGTVGVYNYKTGEILCAVTAPSYDPDHVPDIDGDQTGAYTGVYLNRFIQSAYVPGSIFKIVTTAAALDAVPDILDRSFTCTGVYPYGIDQVTCEHAHGTLNLRQALAHSCNCAFAQIAELVGKENMEKYVRQFAVTEPVTFDGITTAEGHYDVSKAAPVELAWSSIGQYTDLINPCRYMTFMGAIAGGGVGAEPYIVRQVTLGDQVTYEAKPQKSDRIMSREIAETLQEYMHDNVQQVYGAWNFPGLTVCGKSGTSQLGGDLVSNAMFAGFVMDEAYPFAFIAVIENSGYGSANCVPVLSRVLAACKAEVDG